MRIVSAAILVSLPLAIAPGLFFFYDVSPKLLILLLGTAAALVSVAWTGVGQNPVKSPVAKAYLAASLIAIVLTVAASLQANDAALAWTGSSWRRFGAVAQCAIPVLAFLIAFAGKEHFRWVIRPIVMAGGLCAVYGIAQYFGWDPLLDARGYHAGEGPFEIVRPPATLGHSNYLAAFLLAPMFLGIVMVLEETRREWRGAGLGACCACAAAIVLSGSRGGVAGLAAGACVMALLFRPAVRTVGICALVIAAASAMFYVSPAGSRIRARVHWSREDAAGGARLLLWRDSLRLIAARPLLGFGPEGFASAFPRFQSAELARDYPDFYHESPHNMVLDAAASAGIPAALVAVSFVGIGLWGFAAALGRARVLASGLLATLCGSVVAHQFAVFIIPTALLFFLVVAMLAAVAQEGDQPALRPRWDVRVLATGLAATLVIFAGAVGVADRMLAKAKHELDAGKVDDSVAAYYRAAWGRRINIEADLYFSRRFLMAAKDVADARVKFALAQAAYSAGASATESAEQRQNAWYNLAGLAAARNNVQSTEMALRTSINQSPNWFKPHWTLARLLWATGRPAEAAVEARQAMELDGGKHEEVALTLSEIIRSAGTGR